MLGPEGMLAHEVSSNPAGRATKVGILDMVYILFTAGQLNCGLRSYLYPALRTGLYGRIVTLRALTIVPIIGWKCGSIPFRVSRLFLFYIYRGLCGHGNNPGV
jgi:hypothetical protein